MFLNSTMLVRSAEAKGFWSLSPLGFAGALEPRVATTSYGAIYSFPKICSKNALKLLFGVLQNYSKTTKKLLSFFPCFLKFTHFSISLLNDTRILDSANEMRLEQTRSGIYSWSLPDVL